MCVCVFQVTTKENTFISIPVFCFPGNNILYVGMKGPKSPVDELTVKFIGNNQYTINYTVKQQGQYILIVRWGEEDIPGSPFAVEVI